MRPDPHLGELTLTDLHPGASLEQAREATGWELRISPELTETSPVTVEELAALRELINR